MAHNHGALIK
ncbi:MAG: hypothetical protein RLZZ131_1054, partial [Actinomycetota bacterium]